MVTEKQQVLGQTLTVVSPASHQECAGLDVAAGLMSSAAFDMVRPFLCRPLESFAVVVAAVGQY